jgi:hypothetical protein
LALILRFKGGPFAGELREVGDGVERVRFGRDPLRCDVAFPETERAVSREHFALERVLGTWRVVTNGGSPVFVEGRLAHDGMMLALPCELEVGKGGPCVLVDVEGEARLLSTHGERIDAPGAHTRIQRIQSGLARQRVALTAAAVAILGAAAWLAYEVRAGDERVALRLAELDTAQSEALQRSIEAFAKQDPERGDLRDVLDRARASVFAVLALRAERDPEPLGTAFAVAGGRAATNAHVARVVLQRQALRQRVVLRTSSEAPRDHLVVDAVMHPGFEAFLGLMDEYRVIGSITGDALGLVPACDVALLRVDPADADTLPAPLDLAPLDESGALRAGDAVCAAGREKSEP